MEPNFSKDEASIGPPLHYASRCSLLDAVKRLLANGTNVNDKGTRFVDVLAVVSS